MMLSSIPIADAVPVADDELSPVHNDGDDPRDERLRELELQMQALRRLVQAGQDSGPVTTTTTTDTPSCVPWSPGGKKAMLWYAVGGLGLVGIIIVICIAIVTGVADPTDPPREQAILEYLNAITLTGQTLSYPDNATAAGRAVQWLIEDDLGTAPSNELSLRQRYVLATMWHQQGPFNAIDHKATWTNNNLNECDWYDVACYDGGARIVTGLKLQRNGVKEQLPRDLVLLTTLTRLELAENQVSGTISSSLAALTALTELDLSLNKLGGTIPSSLAALTALTHLDLSGNQLKGTIPSSLAALTALEHLYLEDNKLIGTIPSSLTALTALQAVFLYDNQLTGTVPFCNRSEQTQSFDVLWADCDKVSCPCCSCF